MVAVADSGSLVSEQPVECSAAAVGEWGQLVLAGFDVALHVLAVVLVGHH